MRLKQKMRLSIGERLALWHVILLTCFLLILGGVMYVGYYRSTFDKVDTDLIIETDNFQQLNPPRHSAILRIGLWNPETPHLIPLEIIRGC